MIELSGAHVFITGGGGGIGGGIAQAFAECGARIVLADINLDYAKEEAAKLPAGTQVEVLSLDVTSLESWAAARQAAEARFGPVDVLCNNAGVAHEFKPLIEISPETFAQVMAINVNGVFNGVHTFARAMADRGKGHIVNTSSMNGLMPFGSFAAYSGSKFAVLGLSDSLRDELAPAGVGVSTLFPGLTRSRMSVGSRDEQVIDPRIMASMMDPVWLGRAVVRAVENDEAYIITHPEYRGDVAKRHERILAAFGEPAQPGYAQGLTSVS